VLLQPKVSEIMPSHTSPNGSGYGHAVHEEERYDDETKSGYGGPGHPGSRRLERIGTALCHHGGLRIHWQIPWIYGVNVKDFYVGQPAL